MEAVKASEVAEAAEVNEAAEVFKAWKITTEDFRGVLDFEFINLRAKIVLFSCFEKKNDRIMKTHFEFQLLFCQSLLRPAYVTFLKTG